MPELLFRGSVVEVLDEDGAHTGLVGKLIYTPPLNAKSVHIFFEGLFEEAAIPFPIEQLRVIGREF